MLGRFHQVRFHGTVGSATLATIFFRKKTARVSRGKRLLFLLGQQGLFSHSNLLLPQTMVNSFSPESYGGWETSLSFCMGNLLVLGRVSGFKLSIGPSCRWMPKHKAVSNGDELSQVNCQCPKVPQCNCAIGGFFSSFTEELQVVSPIFETQS